MNQSQLEELIEHCPTLYHMAEAGSWQSIMKYGLLSTSALLDLYKVEEPTRSQIEKQHRSSSVKVESDKLPLAVIRDQKPMDDKGLIRCLPSTLSPSDWYQILNSKTFFWLSEDRLHRLTGAKAYRDQLHDIIEVDTQSLIETHHKKIWLCPINSGCTKPFPRKRDEKIFSRIEEYPYQFWQKKRNRGERVVELVVDYSVPDIEQHVKRVLQKRGTEIVKILK